MNCEALRGHLNPSLGTRTSVRRDCRDSQQNRSEAVISSNRATHLAMLYHMQCLIFRVWQSKVITLPGLSSDRRESFVTALATSKKTANPCYCRMAGDLLRHFFTLPSQPSGRCMLCLSLAQRFGFPDIVFCIQTSPSWGVLQGTLRDQHLSYSCLVLFSEVLPTSPR